MSIKDEVLKQLEENKGEYISGGQLATNLNVSRNSIWKAIKTLEKDGYSINAIPNKGYCLEPDNDILSPQSIEQYLNYPLDYIYQYSFKRKSRTECATRLSPYRHRTDTWQRTNG